MRAVPTASKGFIADTSRKARRCLNPSESRHVEFTLTHHGNQHVERLFGNPVEFLDVQQRPVLQRSGKWTGNEDVRVISLAQHAGRVEVTNEARRREFGIALNKLETNVHLASDTAEQGRFAGAGRALDQNVAVGVDRGDHELDFADAADHTGPQPVEQGTQVSRMRQCQT